MPHFIIWYTAPGTLQWVGEARDADAAFAAEMAEWFDRDAVKVVEVSPDEAAEIDEWDNSGAFFGDEPHWLADRLRNTD